MKGQFLALLASRGASSVLLALIHLLVARDAGPATFGIVATVIAAGAFYFVIVDFGLSTAIVRAEAREDEASVRAFLRVNARLSVIGGCLAVLVILGLMLLIQGPLWLAVLGVSMALEKNADTVLGVAVARRSKLIPAVSMVMRRVVAFGVLVTAWWASDDVIFGYVAAMLAGGLVAQVYGRLSLKTAFGISSIKSRAVLKQALPFFWSNISASARNLDIIIVTLLAGARDAGFYGAAQRLTSPFLLIPGAVATLVLPAAARRGPRGAKKLAYQLSWLHLGMLAALGVIALFADEIVVLVLGESYAPAAGILQWSLVAFPFVALSSPLGGVLQSQGHENLVARNGILFSVLLILGIFGGVTGFGVVGAMVAVCAVYALKCFSLVMIIRKVLVT